MCVETSDALSKYVRTYICVFMYCTYVCVFYSVYVHVYLQYVRTYVCSMYVCSTCVCSMYVRVYTCVCSMYVRMYSMYSLCSMYACFLAKPLLTTFPFCVRIYSAGAANHVGVLGCIRGNID